MNIYFDFFKTTVPASRKADFCLGCLDSCVFIDFNFTTDRAFHMYDDRGCYVWSDNADKIRDIYIKRNDWIVEYHRPVIEEYFKL